MLVKFFSENEERFFLNWEAANYRYWSWSSGKLLEKVLNGVWTYTCDPLIVPPYPAPLQGSFITTPSILGTPIIVPLNPSFINNLRLKTAKKS